MFTIRCAGDRLHNVYPCSDGNCRRIINYIFTLSLFLPPTHPPSHSPVLFPTRIVTTSSIFARLFFCLAGCLEHRFIHVGYLVSMTIDRLYACHQIYIVSSRIACRCIVFCCHCSLNARKRARECFFSLASCCHRGCVSML